MGRDEIRAGEGATGIGTGDADGVISGIMQSVEEW